MNKTMKNKFRIKIEKKKKLKKYFQFPYLIVSYPIIE